MAETLAGKWSTKRLSRLAGLDVAELSVWVLLLLGFLVAVLHSKLDYSLGLPGHHGLELMTALMFARLVSRERWACLIVATGTVGGDLVPASDLMHNLKHVPLYFLVGGLVDLLYRLLGERCHKPAYAALIGGAVHMTKPLIMTSIALATGAAFGVPRHGPIFPILTHFAFGAIGAVCGALLARAYLDARRVPPPEPIR
ncbi:MAG: hypothetical protein ACREU7_01405 [Burkholderiales bacterium]